LDTLIVINLLRRPNRARTSGSHAEDRYYQSHTPWNPRVLPLVGLASFVAAVALGIDLWRF
jgi:hypothetical protein